MSARTRLQRCAAPENRSPRKAEPLSLPAELRTILDPLEVTRASSVSHHDVFARMVEGPPVPLHPDAWAKVVPPSVVECFLGVIKDKKRVLLVGDRPGDPDCFSAIALARFLRLLGVEVDTHVGVRPPRQITDLIEPKDLASESEVRAKNYDAVVFIDNDGTGARISPAAHEAASKASQIVIIDHHAPTPYPKRAGQELHTWIEERADAAALMELGLMAALSKDLKVPLSNDDWVRVAEPLLAGIYSDTGKLAPETTKSGALETYLYLAELVGKPTMDLIRKGFDAELPLETRKSIKANVSVDFMGTAPHRALFCAFKAPEDRHGLSSGDLYRAVLDQVHQLRDEHSPSVSVALVALPADEEFGPRVLVSVRTLERTRAGQLAKALGNGNGKPNGQAGATVLVPPGQTLEGLLAELEERTRELVETALDQAKRLSAELGLRRGNI